tara:strand:- start:531 stop:716 length:186 start_codon:yes stop_codon:yes gene_type:complete
MANIKINDKDYDLDSLSDEVKANIASLQFVQNELKTLQSKIAVYKTAESLYAKTIQDKIDN